MALYHFVLLILVYSTELLSVCTAESSTEGIKLANVSNVETEDGSVSASSSAVVTFTGSFKEISESEYNSSTGSDTTFKWSDANFRTKEKEEGTEEETQYAFSTPLTTEELTSFKYKNIKTNPTFKTENLQNDSNDTSSTSFKYKNLKTNPTFKTENLQNDSNDTVMLKTSSNTQEQQFQSESTQTIGSLYEESTLENSDVTVLSEQENLKNSSSDLREPTSASNKGQENILMLLKSNCSLLNNEKIAFNEDFTDMSCTILLRVNVSSDNETRERLLSTLEKLTVKQHEFQVVEKHNQDEGDQGEQMQRHKHYTFLLEPETFAYLAVAFAFAFLLLLAVIVFGLRCFKKRRPSLDISRFDVKLSNYTLTKIPRASLSSLDCLHESDCLDDKPESSTVRNKDNEPCEPGHGITTTVDYESCHSSYDMFPSAMYSSNREMKTFGVTRANENRNVDSRSDMIPRDNPVAYENHTFH